MDRGLFLGTLKGDPAEQETVTETEGPGGRGRKGGRRAGENILEGSMAQCGRGPAQGGRLEDGDQGSVVGGQDHMSCDLIHTRTRTHTHTPAPGPRSHGAGRDEWSRSGHGAGPGARCGLNVAVPGGRRAECRAGDSKPSYRVRPAQDLARRAARPLAGRQGHGTGGSREKGRLRRGWGRQPAAGGKRRPQPCGQATSAAIVL